MLCSVAWGRGGGVEPCRLWSELVMPLVEIEAKRGKTLTVKGLEACGWHAVGAVEFPHRVPVELELMVWYLLFKSLHHISQRLKRQETNSPFECRITPPVGPIVDLRGCLPPRRDAPHGRTFPPAGMAPPMATCLHRTHVQLEPALTHSGLQTFGRGCRQVHANG